MNKLTVKKVEIARKGNYTFADFSAKYGLSEIDVKREIRRVYQSKARADEIIREFAKNSRKQARRNNGKEVTVQDLTGENVAAPTPTTVADEHAQLLRTLRLRELDLANEVMEREAAYYDKRSEHASTQERLGKSMRYLESLYGQLKKAVDETEKIQEREAAISEEVKQAQTAMEGAKAQLEEVRTRIEEEQKLVIYVYSDGSVEYSRGGIPNRDEGRWLEILKGLVVNEACRELRQFELHSLATVLEAIEQAQAEQYELIAENDSFMSAFEAVKGTLSRAAA